MTGACRGPHTQSRAAGRVLRVNCCMPRRREREQTGRDCSVDGHSSCRCSGISGCLVQCAGSPAVSDSASCTRTRTTCDNTPAAHPLSGSCSRSCAPGGAHSAAARGSARLRPGRCPTPARAVTIHRTSGRCCRQALRSARSPAGGAGEDGQETTTASAARGAGRRAAQGRGGTRGR
jgi:hypothetical protein